MDRSLIAGVRIQTVRRMQLTDTDEESIFSGLHPPLIIVSPLLQRATIATCDRIRDPDRRQRRASHRLMIFQRRSLNNISPYTYRATPVFETIPLDTICDTYVSRQSRRSGGREPDEGTWRVPWRHTHAQRKRDIGHWPAQGVDRPASYSRYVIFCRYITLDRVLRTLLQKWHGLIARNATALIAACCCYKYRHA